MRSHRWFLVPFFLIVAGCGGGGRKLVTHPPFKQSVRVVIAPFAADEHVGNLGERIPMTLGTRFQPALKQTQWIYDQSDTLNPVTAKLDEFNLTPISIFFDAALAAKVGKALNAKLIVVGRINALKIRREDLEKPVAQHVRQTWVLGTTRYYLCRHQSATIRAHFKVVDTQLRRPIFENSVTDVFRYWVAYSSPEEERVIFKTDTEILEDFEKHLPMRIAHALYPFGMPLVKSGEILLIPDLKSPKPDDVVNINLEND
ncbi:MAG: hypothetical protein O7E52_07420 [Candidatus Poribacteria bacterium]|nr:hypothetical protein [Candidatus Poribacteria bacterium]